MIDNIMTQICNDMDVAYRLFATIKRIAKQKKREPRIKVSPYAKFDKFHHKKKRK